MIKGYENVLLRALVIIVIVLCIVTFTFVVRNSRLIRNNADELREIRQHIEQIEGFHNDSRQQP